MTLSPLNLSIALSAIIEGVKAVRSGQTEEGLRLIEHAVEYLEKFLPNGEQQKDAA